MICKYCGNEVDDGLAVCPVCNSPMDEYEQSNYSDQQRYDSYSEADDDFDYSSDDVHSKPSGKKLPLPKLPNITMSTLISIAAAFFSFICLVMVCFLNGTIKDRANTLNASVAQLQMSYSSLEDKISRLDSTVANVQKDAYNQLASTTITITKDLTSLTGPVTLGKYNMMFIIKVKGNLDLGKSFVWRKYNPTTNGWEDIVFTGNATSNEQYGLRLENVMESGEYKSVLWANGITKEAEGSYRCVITDVNGIKKTSLEASVSVTDAAE